MAQDIVEAMNLLNISNADIMGVSQGGMIAQCIAINNPERVNTQTLLILNSLNQMIVKK